MQKQNTAQPGKCSALLGHAVSEAQRDTATRFSSWFDGLIAHISKSELNRTEIIELLGQESEKLHNAIFGRVG
ncbi:DUF2732 family protein [Enterobacter roggenkampii]|uniref:DUF2732 family protein n=1 Tax=Enterobacter roggenkampii TaxID=1812935 RepID=UPI002005C86C|nr:DUF2732 family protein [Enterobacter roggenkampii]MCK7178795.1 DUF2732 domain-containing protein [Enterobacter roggenkampii]